MNLSLVYEFSPFFNSISHTFDKNIINQIKNNDFNKKLVNDVFWNSEKNSTSKIH